MHKHSPKTWLVASRWLPSFVLVFVLAGCDWPGRPRPEDRPVPENRVMNFDVLFQQNCAGCHGRDGRLGPAPPLNDPIFLAIVPDEELLHVIGKGRHGTPMPPFSSEQGGLLTEEQVKVLAEGIKPRWQSAQPVPSDLPPYTLTKADAGEPPAAQHERGAAVFARACADCHGAQGKGDPDGGTPGRVNDPAFLSLISDQALRRLVITGRPDLGMPDFAGTDGRDSSFKPLDTTEIADLITLLISWRRGPTVAKVAADNIQHLARDVHVDGQHD